MEMSVLDGGDTEQLRNEVVNQMTVVPTILPMPHCDSMNSEEAPIAVEQSL